MKNVYEVRGDVTAIITNSRKYGKAETLISTSKIERAKEFPNSWYPHFDKSTQSFYVHGILPAVNGKGVTVLLHRWVADAAKGFVVDHINHDTLDNTDSNLRLATKSENGQNRRGAIKNSKSGIRGISWSKSNKKWQAQIVIKYKHTHLGFYDDKEEAEQAVIEARKKYMPYSQEASS